MGCLHEVMSMEQRIELLLTTAALCAFAATSGQVRRDLAAGRLPSVQPFHAMAYPFSAELALQISIRYAEHCSLAASRISLPRLPHPAAVALAPGQRLRVGYVSSDFGNHPLSHLMGGVFGLHDRSRVEVFCYALSPSDGSEWRLRIEGVTEHFMDVSSESGCLSDSIVSLLAACGVLTDHLLSCQQYLGCIWGPVTHCMHAAHQLDAIAKMMFDCCACVIAGAPTGWSVADIARKISADGIHVACNLNGYTKGARNEIFALWPAPVQTSYMGFPATTGNECNAARGVFFIPKWHSTPCGRP